MPPWLQTMLDILLGGPEASAGEVLLRGSLIGCSLFASVQWMTMFATRWGDHHAMAKSFVLSVMVHLCIGLGWATAVQTNRALATPDAVLVPIPIRQVLLESPEEISQPDPGNTPIWQQPLDVPDLPLARAQRDAAPRPEEAPERMQVEPAPAAPPELVDFASPVEDTAPAPETMKLTSTPTPAAAAEIQGVTEETSAAREELRPVAARPARQTLNRPDDFEPLPTSDPQIGSALRAAPDSQSAAMSLPLTTAPEAELPKAVGAVGEAIIRQASPVASPIDVAETGSQPSSQNSTTEATARETPRFTRVTRSPAASGNPPVEMARIDTPRPVTSGAVPGLANIRRPSMLDGDATPSPEAVRSLPNSAPLGDRAQAASTYRLRRLERRRDIALRNGGTVESEKAVESALAYLARIQEPEGFWDADRHGGGAKEVRQIDAGKPPGGTEADTGLTGLSILAFLGAGYTHEEGVYEHTVSNAIQWLIAQQRSDGYLGGKATYYDQMYCHGIATYALAEAYGMQNDATRYPALREAVARGVWYISETQNSDGGWRYRVGASLSDMSMFGWQLMALKSAELAGISTPEKTRSDMIRFLRERSRGAAGGLAGYKQDSPPTPAMTAEAFFCKQMYGLRRNSPAGLEATRYLQSHLPQLSRPDEYYWYYGTLAMFQYGGEPWDAWNASMRDTLVRLQRRNGNLDGSWDPIGPWSSVGGRVYSTALSTMCLEVYYRFLPLYQVGSDSDLP